MFNVTERGVMKKPIYKRVWFWIVIVVVVLAVGGAGLSSSDGDSTAGDTTVASSSNDVTEADTSDDVASESEEESVEYTVENLSIEGDEYGISVTISGTFTNLAGKDLSYVQLSFNLYDSDGAQIDTALANTSNLSAGASWKFEAVSVEDIENVADYELVDVTYW